MILFIAFLGAVVGLAAGEAAYLFQFDLDRSGQNDVSTQFQLGDHNVTPYNLSNGTYGKAIIVGTRGTLHIVIDNAETGEEYLNKTLPIDESDFGIVTASQQIDPYQHKTITQTEPMYKSKNIILDKTPQPNSLGHAVLDASLIFTSSSGKSIKGVTGILWR